MGEELKAGVMFGWQMRHGYHPSPVNADHGDSLAVIFLLAVLPVRVLVPLTEGIWFHASAHAHAAVELGDGENENKEDQCC